MRYSSVAALGLSVCIGLAGAGCRNESLEAARRSEHDVQPHVQQAREETAGDALWALAERFRTEGDADARTRTLRFLVERYPSSRFAVEARHELGAGTTGAAGDAGP